MIDPVNDPIFGENSNTRKLLESADEATVRNLASAWNRTGYTPTAPAFDYRRDDPASRDIGQKPEGAGFSDTLSAAWHLNNLTGAIAYRMSNYLSANFDSYGVGAELGPSPFDQNWTIQKFGKENFGSFSDAGKAAFLSGEFDDVLSPTEFFVRYGQVEQEAQYRRDLANASGVGGWTGAVVGSFADPIGLLVGLGVGKVAVGAYQTVRTVQGVTLAAELANLGAQQVVKTGLLARVGQAVGEGIAISASTETGLQMLDSKRTWQEGVTNIAAGIVFDSFLAAGLGYLGRRPLFSKKTLQVIPDAQLTDELRQQVEAAVNAKVMPDEVVEAAQEIAAGIRSVNTQNLTNSTRTKGYDDFLFSFPNVNPARSRAILNLLDKYGQNSVAPLRPMSSIEKTSTGPLAMLYNYFVVPRGPTIGLAQGRSGGLMPFEMVSELVRSKGNMMQERSAKAFRDFVTEQGINLREWTLLRTPEALWMGEKGSALLAKQEAFYNLAGKVYILAHNTDEALASGIPLEKLAETGFKNFREAAPGELAKYLNRLGEADTARLTASLQKLYDETLPTMNELWIAPDMVRSTMGGPRTPRPVSLALMGDLQARLPEGFGSADSPFNLNDFAHLWDTQTGQAPPLGAQLGLFPNVRAPNRAQAVVEFFHQQAGGIDLVDVNRAVPEHQTLGRLKNAYYHTFGGYVPASTAHRVAILTAENGTTLAEFNYNKLLSQTTEGKHLFEGARQLKDYIYEASQFDKRLHEKLFDPNASFAFDDAPYSLPTNGKGQPVDRFYQLAGTRLQHWDTDLGNPLPAGGYRKELEDWTNEAMAIIRQNVLLHIPETAADLRPKSAGTSDHWITQEKTKTNDMVRMLKDRLGMEYQGKAHWENELSRNVGALTRGMFLPTAAVNQLPDAVNAIVATATSPFKGDMLAVIKGGLSQVRRNKLRPETVPFILDHIEYMNESLLSIMYRNTSYLRRVEELNTAVKGFTFGERSAAFMEGIAQRSIAVASGGDTMNDFVRSAAFHSTNAQVTLKGGLITRMANVLQDLNAGATFEAALAKHDVPLFFGATMMRDFTPNEIHALNALVEADSTAGVKTPRRFGLSRIMGDAEVKVLDLPENPDLADKMVLQKLGAYMNFLMTREKLALTGWGDDLIGGTGSFWRFIGTFWAKPTIGQFNRMFYQAQYKGDKALALGFLGGMLSSMSARFLKVWLNGNLDKEVEDAERNWGLYVTHTIVDRAAWAGMLGVGGEKMAAAAVGGLLPNPSGRSGQNAFFPAPLSAMWQATQGALALPKLGYDALFDDGKLAKSDADAMWKLLSAVGFSNDTTMFRLMGQLGRSTGVYGEQNNAADIKASYYRLFGVEESK